MGCPGECASDCSWFFSEPQPRGGGRRAWSGVRGDSLNPVFIYSDLFAAMSSNIVQWNSCRESMFAITKFLRLHPIRHTYVRHVQIAA